MKKLIVVFIALFALGSYGFAGADPDTNAIKEPGSILVFPLIDNINYETIVEITNLGNDDVWLAGYIILHKEGKPLDLKAYDFRMHLTTEEPFVWNTSKSYNREDIHGYLTQLQGHPDEKGYMFVWAIENPSSRLEKNWNELIGDCLVFDPANAGRTRAFQYNPIPHQAIDIDPNRVLDLDGVEYTRTTSQVMVQGFAAEIPTISDIDGTFVVCSLDLDFILSKWPKFDINIDVYNQFETGYSRHLSFRQFIQYVLSDDDPDYGLDITWDSNFTAKFQFSTTPSPTETNAIWCIFFQTTGGWMWGGNVWQEPEAGADAQVILPPVPLLD